MKLEGIFFVEVGEFTNDLTSFALSNIFQMLQKPSVCKEFTVFGFIDDRLNRLVERVSKVPLSLGLGSLVLFLKVS